MARWSGKRARIWLASACLLGGCSSGGQTGQPGIVVCDEHGVPAEQPVKGVSPSELARAFEGQHTSALRWLVTRPRDAGAALPDDAITVDVVYQGADGVTTCDDLQVKVSVGITTRDSAVKESGSAMLAAGQGSLDEATLYFSGKRVVVSAVLQRSNGAVELSGRLQSLAGDLPGDRAEFPPAPAGSDGTGGGGAGGGAP